MNASTALNAAPAAGGCPRCQKPMIDPQGLGWCQACGYCRSLHDVQQKAAPAASAAPTRLAVTGAAVGQMPAWFLVAFLGAMVLACATFAAAHYLALKPFERALFTTVQMAFGFALLFAAQLLALLRIAPEDASLGFIDVVFPFRLYGLALKRLPATRHAVCLGVWGLAAILAANLFIGGLDHWLNYMPGRNKNRPNQVQKTKSAR